MTSERLPPWPDELLRPDLKPQAIAWILNTGLPTRFRALHLQRWGEYTGAELTREDYYTIGRPRPREGG